MHFEAIEQESTCSKTLHIHTHKNCIHIMLWNHLCASLLCCGHKKIMRCAELFIINRWKQTYIFRFYWPTLWLLLLLFTMRRNAISKPCFNQRAPYHFQLKSRAQTWRHTTHSLRTFTYCNCWKIEMIDCWTEQLHQT